MATYFSGRKLLKDFSTLSSNRRTRIDWRISEEWRDIDEGTASNCGVEGTCTVEAANGISEKTLSTLKQVAGATLGLKDVLSLKYDVELSLGREVNWQVSKKSVKTFRIQPPKCGRCALTVYQLFRIYELTCSRKKWLSFDEEKWVKLSTRTVEERTNNHDAILDTVESDPACRCANPPPEPKFDGLMQLSFGTIGLRVPYRLTEAGLELRIDRQAVRIGGTDLPADGCEVEIDASLVPEPLRFLGKVEEAATLRGRMEHADETDAFSFDIPLTAEAELGAAVVAPDQLLR
jgi:hypothetical protein